jgi:hypothetical protein
MRRRRPDQREYSRRPQTWSPGAVDSRQALVRGTADAYSVEQEAAMVGLPRYDYFDHDADTGVIGRGATLQEAFVHAAEAMFALMCDPVEVEHKERIEFEFVEDDPELALVTWLNLLLAHANERGLALGHSSRARRSRGTASRVNRGALTWNAERR